MWVISMIWTIFFSSADPQPIQSRCIGHTVYDIYPNSDFLVRTHRRCGKKNANEPSYEIQGAQDADGIPASSYGPEPKNFND